MPPFPPSAGWFHRCGRASFGLYAAPNTNIYTAAE